MHRVVSQCEFVGMACRRSKDEFGVGFRGKVDRFVRRLEDYKFTSLDVIGNCKASLTESDPTNSLIGTRLIAP